MRFGDETKTGYFSVTYMATVGQMRCVPQVCYKLDDSIRGAIERMAANGLARIYDEEVRFISGAPVPLNKPVASRTVQAATGSTVIHKAADTPVGPQIVRPAGKRGGKRTARTFE